MLHRLWEWLHRAPISDPLDRQNAPGAQLALLLTGVLEPLVVLSSWKQSGTYSFGIGIGLIIAPGLWFCLWLVRRGQFRTAATLIYAGFLALVVLSHQAYGLRSQAGLQIAHLLPLLLGGLLLGRRALWLGLSVLAGAVLLGGWVDSANASRLGWGWDETGAGVFSSLLTFFIATVVLDRLVSASRNALRRSEELDQAYHNLEHEMAEKEQSQAQLLQAQKLELLGRIAGGIAHDFNNLLGVIMGYVGIARSRDGYDGQPIEGIENAARRGAMMTRRLLGLGRDRPRQPEVFDVCQAVQQAMALIRPLFRQGAAVEVHLPEHSVPVRLDRDEFELALLNLGTNARDAMQQGGRFCIEVEDQADSGSVRIIVSDTGCGMTPEVIARIFEPFFTTKPEGRGTGIGMAVVHRLVSDAHGRIEVESAPEQGTRITLELPRAQETITAPTQIGAGRRVLLVEDDGELRVLLAEALEAAGYQVRSAADQAQALQLASGLFLPDVVISDLRLPDGDGEQLLMRLGRLWPSTQRLLITSHRQDDEVALGDPGIVLLRKPFSAARLLELLSQAATPQPAQPAAAPDPDPADSTDPTDAGDSTQHPT